MNALMAGLLGALGSRGRRSGWGGGAFGPARFGRSTGRRHRARRGGFLGPALLAGAAYWFARRRRARAGATGAPLSTHEAVPEL